MKYLAIKKENPTYLFCITSYYFQKKKDISIFAEVRLILVPAYLLRNITLKFDTFS